MASEPPPTLNTGISNQFQQLDSDNTPTPASTSVMVAPAMDSIIHSSDLTYHGLLATMQVVGLKSNGPLSSLPVEVFGQVCGYLHTQPLPEAGPVPATTWVPRGPHPALTPPSSGTCPLLKLPVEVREKVFASWLPARDVTIEPRGEEMCDQKLPSRKPRTNRTSDFMVLNKQIKKEITHVVYEERIFKIDVHQDLDEGGIEFLDAGRQPLQYQDNISDNRFTRFGDGQEFGFSRLKKIEIAIFSATGDFKHCAMNAYYMNLALVKLLERGAGKENKNKISSITITFPEPHSETQAGEATTRRAIMRGEYFWWDPDAGKPRSTSTFGVPDIEFVLRPFANLSAHNVSIVLPHGVNKHDKTIEFVARLENSMKTGRLLDANEEEFEMHMDFQRAAFEDYLFNRKHGSKKVNDYKWSERECMQSDEKDSSKRRKVFQEDDTMDEDTLALIEDEDLAEQNALLLASSEKKWQKGKKSAMSGMGRRLGHEIISMMSDGHGTSGNSLLASLAAERAQRASSRTSLDSDKDLI